jgi:hypothetical protein
MPDDTMATFEIKVIACDISVVEHAVDTHHCNETGHRNRAQWSGLYL